MSIGPPRLVVASAMMFSILAKEGKFAEDGSSGSVPMMEEHK
jgi:hypothetical protein